MFKNKKGFTLIELIITIIIITILAGAAIVAIRVKTMEARDARRFSDLQAIHLAMEMSAVSGESLTLPANESMVPSVRQLSGSSYLDFSNLTDPFFDEESADAALGCLPGAIEPCQYAFVDYDTGEAFASAPLVVNPSRYRINFYEERAEYMGHMTESEIFTSQGSTSFDEGDPAEDPDEEPAGPCTEIGNAVDDATTILDASGISFGQYNKMKDKTQGNAKDNGWGHTKDGDDVWAEVSWAQGKLLNKMRIWSHFANGAEAIKDFQILASNNRSSWIVLYTGTHPGEGFADFVDYMFPNDTAYKFYRLLVLSNYPGDGGDDIGLEEIELLCEN